MYKYPGDYLLTYDPTYAEEHTDSSDFEESCVPLVSKKGGKHSLLNHKSKKNTYQNRSNFTHKQCDYDKYPVKLKRDCEEFWGTKAVQVSIKPNKKKQKQNLSRGDQPEPVQSKLSLIRHKVIPCISSIFKKSLKHGNMSVINEDTVQSTTDSWQHCRNCEKRRMKQFKRQNYAVQPVYALEGNIHKAPPPFTPNMNEPLKHNRKKSRNQYSSCSISSSSENEMQLSEKMKEKSKKMRKRFKKEVMKEHWKYQQSHLRNQQHQYPSKDGKSSYQVFSSPYQHSRTDMSPSESQYSQMPASSSGFWEYLFDKINRKYQVQAMEMPKPCQCNSSEDQVPCSPGNCKSFEPKSEPSGCKGRQRNLPGNNCSCSTPKPEPSIGGCCQKNSIEISPPPLPFNMPRNSLSLKVKAAPPEKKVQCKCHDKADRQSNAPSSRASTRLPSQGGTSAKPCQEGHDEITAALTEKYKGEILCIHNPPCILINGCLNLPPPKDSPQTMNFWPVTESKKSAFSSYKKPINSNQKCDNSCQYHVPFVEVRQCQTPEYRVEKKIQSICHHDPPCEVVRGCYKPKYDPQLQNSCVHVPMCPRVPECIIGQRLEGRRSCEHKPRCPDIPVCSRNYTVLTARDNVGTQVRPKTSLNCRHMPPCIMIPKCLGRALNHSFISWDAVPDCNHQPPCELIPACCRKSTKEMVSTSSQYPNSCRIV